VWAIQGVKIGSHHSSPNIRGGGGKGERTGTGKVSERVREWRGDGEMATVGDVEFKTIKSGRDSTVNKIEGLQAEKRGGGLRKLQKVAENSKGQRCMIEKGEKGRQVLSQYMK